MSCHLSPWRGKNNFIILIPWIILLITSLEIDTRMSFFSMKAGSDAETEGATNLHFLELFVKYSGIPRSLILKEIPVVILDHSLVKMTK